MERLANILIWVASGFLMALMALTFVDVVGRAFDAPLKFQVELVQMLLGLVVMLGMVATTLHQGHISVDLIGGALSPAMRRFLDRLGALAGTVILGVIAWRLWVKAVDFAADGRMTDILNLPIDPVVRGMAAGAALSALISAIQILRPGWGRGGDLDLEGYE